MRLGRLVFILLAIYFVFIGGSAYYTLIFPVRQIHHILVTVVLALWLVAALQRGGLPKTPINLPIVAVVMVWIISAATSIDRRMAFENLWFPLTHMLFFFVLVDLFQRGRQRLLMETQFMLGAAVVMLSGLEVASWYFGLGIIPGTQTGWVDVIGSGAWLPLAPIRLSLAMNISTLLAGYVAPLITLTAVWALTVRRRDYRRVLWILAGALLVVLVFTFSRGGMLSVLTAVGILGVFWLLQMPRVTHRISARMLIGVAGFVGAAVVAGYVILSLTQARSGNTGDEGRLDMWRNATAMVQDYPVQGVGPGLFGRAFRSYRDPTIVQDKLASAHNAYLNTAAETGLLGIAASIWLAVTFLKTWYHNWQQSKTRRRKLRLEAGLAALLGLGVHSMVDVFTITPIVLLMLLLAAYCITPGDMLYEGRREPLPGNIYRRLTTILALILVIGYGVWLFQLDRAQARYLNSFGDPSSALSEAQAAAEIDPDLNLYSLQIAYLSGQNSANSENAIKAYQQALALEPTWDIGWINLAALEVRQGNDEIALSYLDKAWQINSHNLASLHWATWAENLEAAPEAMIVEAYVNILDSPRTFLPLSRFWWETEARRAAVEQFISDRPVDIQYRVLAVHAPERASQLVSPSPQSAAEWWVVAEYALSVKHDAESAATYFGEAILRAASNGDYYASRARATYQTDAAGARRDLDIAALLGTNAEYPNAVRAEMAATAEEAERLLANALPVRITLQEFAAVLYGRPATFDVLPEMRGIGPGRTAMHPWYQIAADRLAAGNIEGATNAYRAILDYAPDEQEAYDTLTTIVEQ
jgi:O-antigen ligase/tetratricopeptide (TPR) repeat protein